MGEWDAVRPCVGSPELWGLLHCLWPATPPVCGGLLVPGWGGGMQMGRGQAGRERGCIQMPPLPQKGGETLSKEPALLSLSF